MPTTDTIDEAALVILSETALRGRRRGVAAPA